MELKIVAAWSLNEGGKVGKFFQLHQVGWYDVWDSSGWTNGGLTPMQYSALISVHALTLPHIEMINYRWGWFSSQRWREIIWNMRMQPKKLLVQHFLGSSWGEM